MMTATSNMKNTDLTADMIVDFLAKGRKITKCPTQPVDPDTLYNKGFMGRQSIAHRGRKAAGLRSRGYAKAGSGS